MDSFGVTELASEASRAPYAEEMNYQPVPWSPFTLADHLILAYNDVTCWPCACSVPCSRYKEASGNHGLRASPQGRQGNEKLPHC